MHPRHVRLLALLLVLPAGCGQQEDDRASSGAGAAPAQTGGLTGLYESGGGPRRDQLCVIEREGRSATFGLIVWGPEDRNCSASGTVRRDGDRLRLLFDGDERCTLEARPDGSRIALTGTLSPECAHYYCGAGARLDGAAFDKVGGTDVEARRAVDLVGDPLCGD